MYIGIRVTRFSEVSRKFGVLKPKIIRALRVPNNYLTRFRTRSVYPARTFVSYEKDSVASEKCINCKYLKKKCIVQTPSYF